MADEREVSALKASVNAMHQAAQATGKTPKNYLVHARVMDECVEMPVPAEPEGEAGKTFHNYLIRAQVMDECVERPVPPTEPGEDPSVNARLNRLEAQLQRVIAMLEQRGS